jgi:hypothetical protein
MVHSTMLVILYAVLVMWWSLNVQCFKFNLCILCYWHNMYIVVTCTMLCNVILGMQVNTNTNTTEDPVLCNSKRK